MNYIIYNGVNSNTINGLLISELPPISRPPMRAKETSIDGVDGSIIEELGYESYEKELTIGLYGNYDIDSIIEYFSGSGTVTFSNEADKYYNVHIIDQIDYERLLRYRTATVTFLTQPFKYSTAEETLTANVVGLSSYTIANSGNTKSKPVITINGTGDITVKVNNITVFEYSYPEGETTVTFDSEKQDCYVETVLKNRYMNGNFIELSKGSNVISWEGTITSLAISKRSRWL